MAVADLQERLAWAQRHARNTSAAATRVLEEGYTLVCFPLDGGLVHSFKIYELPKIPPRLPLRLGDFLHNCRAVLDGIAYELARQEAARDAGQLVFPICEHEHQWDNSLHRLHGLSADTVEWIRSVQPFATDRFREPLLACEELNNIDKHRRLNMLLQTATGHVISPFDPNVAEDFRTLGPLHEGIEIARLTFHEPQPEQYATIRPAIALGVEKRWGMNDLLNSIPACLETLLTEGPFGPTSP